MILDNARFTIIRDRWAKGEKELFCAGNLGGWTPDLQWSSITCWLFKGVLYRCSTSLALSMFTSQGAATNEFVSQGSKIETLSHCPEQHKVAPLLCRSYTTIKERAEHSIRVGHLQHPTAKPPGLLSTDFLFFLFFFLYRETLQPCCCEAEQFLCYFGWLVTNSMKTFRCKVSWLDAVWSGTPSMWRGQIWCFSRVRVSYSNVFIILTFFFNHAMSHLYWYTVLHCTFHYSLHSCVQPL